MSKYSLCRVQLERLPTTGVVTSPNYPDKYPNNLDRTETIQVESGKVLRIEFTFTAIWVADGCPSDWVKITDWDGTTLLGKGCGYSDRSPTSSSYFLPPIITSVTNTVDIFFHTDGSGSRNGWSLNWTSVAPGLNPLLAKFTLKLTILQSGKIGKQKRQSTHLKDR